MHRFPRMAGGIIPATRPRGLSPGPRRVGLLNVIATLLVVLTLGSLLPTPVAAQPAIDPAAIALTPTDLPPGFAVAPEETRSEPLTGARCVTFRQLLKR